MQLTKKQKEIIADMCINEFQNINEIKYSKFVDISKIKKYEEEIKKILDLMTK